MKPGRGNRVSWEHFSRRYEGWSALGKKGYREKKRILCVCVKVVLIYKSCSFNSDSGEPGNWDLPHSSSPFSHHTHISKSLCDLLWFLPQRERPRVGTLRERWVDDHADSWTHGKTCPAAPRSAYETKSSSPEKRTSFNIHEILRLSVTANSQAT